MSTPATTLVIAVHHETGLDPLTARLVGAATKLGGPIELLVLGEAAPAVLDEASVPSRARTPCAAPCTPGLCWPRCRPPVP
jgi:hypothetical protein